MAEGDIIRVERVGSGLTVTREGPPTKRKSTGQSGVVVGPTIPAKVEAGVIVPRQPQEILQESAQRGFQPAIAELQRRGVTPASLELSSCAKVALVL